MRLCPIESGTHKDTAAGGELLRRSPLDVVAGHAVLRRSQLAVVAGGEPVDCSS